MKDEVMKVQVALPFLPFNSQNLMPEEKLCAFLLPLSHLCKRSWGSANRATSIHLEKHYRDYGAKGALKTGKLSNYDQLDQIHLKSMGMSTFALPNWLSDVVLMFGGSLIAPSFGGELICFLHLFLEDRKITGTVEDGVCKLFGINLVENRTEPSLLPHAATSQPALHLLCRILEMRVAHLQIRNFLEDKMEEISGLQSPARNFSEGAKVGRKQRGRGRD
ncbi:hypothetical protein ACLOJK_016709 [Asimina triloba]